MFKKFTVESLKPTFKKYAPAAVAVGTMLVAGTASADIPTEIQTAIDSAKGNVGIVATGLITIAAVMAGIGLVVSALKR